MMDSSKRDIGSVLVEFARILAEDRSAESILRALGDYCTELFEVEAIGVLLLEQGSLTVATANSTIGDRAEHLEVQLDEGPCVDCVRTGEHVIVPDLREALDRYPVFERHGHRPGATTDVRCDHDGRRARPTTADDGRGPRT